jgi:hypothetical protein
MATLRWLWVMLAGQALCILSALLAAATGVNALAWTSIVGFAVFMTGSVLLVDWRVQFHELPGLRRLVGLGIAAGIVASAVSIPIELAAVHGLGIGPVLWLSGPIEETAKLLVPIALLAWGVKALREPKAGLFVVVVSAATFGAIEGAVWESRRSDIWLHLEMAIVRPGAELIHPFLTGFAAAVIWLAARRAGRVVTRSGVLAFALIVVVHSVHDGIATLLLLRKGERIGTPSVYSPGVAITRGVASWLVLFLQAVAVYVLLRHAARELVGPTHLATSPPQWRPRIKPWGLRRGARAHAIATNLNARR